MAYSCWAALSAAYRTLSRSFPNGRCGPCFSRMPNGSRHVPCARAMASRNSAADSSSQWTESLLCGEGDCAHTVEAQRALMERSRDLRKGPSSVRGPRALMLLARGDSCQVHAAVPRLYGWVGPFDHEPQHDRQLPEQGRLREGKHLVLIIRKEQSREAQDHVGDAVDDQPHANEPRQETRLVGQGPHREEPEPPQDLGGNDLSVMQAQEHQDQSITLRL